MKNISKKIEKKAKFFIRKIINCRQWCSLRHAIRNNFIFFDLKESFSEFGNKVFRPYLSTSLKESSRLKIILNHYEIINNLGLLPFFKEANKNPKVILKFSAKNSEIFKIEFESDLEDEQEGDAFLSLVHKDNCIQKIGFCLFYENGNPCIFVAVNQGIKSENSKEQIKEVTKLLYGNRPKEFLIILLLNMGKKLGFETLVGVGNKNRVGAIWPRSQDKKISACYDSLWLSFDGKPNGLGDYLISFKKNYNHNPIETKSNKRSQKRKRDLLRDNISNQILKIISDVEEPSRAGGVATKLEFSACRHQSSVSETGSSKALG